MIENIRIALEGIRLNKMRSFLTMLGIIIGISSVITIQTLGDGLKKSVKSGLDTFGSNQMYAHLEARKGWSWGDLRFSDFFNLEKIKRVKEYFSDIDEISVSESSVSAQVKNGRKKAQVSMTPCLSGEEKTANLNMVAGRFFDDETEKAGKFVCVISKKLVDKLYDGATDKVLGMEIDCQSAGKKLYTFTVVGVYKKSEAEGLFMNFNSDEQTALYLPLHTGLRHFYNTSAADFTTSIFNFRNKDGTDGKKLKEDMKKYFEKNGYGEKDRAEVTIESLEEQMKEADNIMRNITLGISIIAAISLLVGGIGVMNILLVSVTERTREIGIRKALGATNRDIRVQFITESIILCVVGGIMGVAIGSVLGYIGSGFMQSPTLPNLATIVYSVCFSMLVGVFFGFYPANRAAKLNPIDALRYE